MSTAPNHPASPAPDDALASSRLAARTASTEGGPIVIAVRHLRRRPVAVVCFIVLCIYFLITAASYVDVPGARLIGDRFEEMATLRLIGPDGKALEFVPPTLGRPDLTDVAQRDYPADAVARWEARGEREPLPALSVHFLFGTDLQGRSVLWRMLYGARVSLSVAFGASLLALFIGTTLGALAGYFGGPVDAVITWLFTTVASIPRILLVLAMAYALRDLDLTFFGLLDPSSDAPGMIMLILAMGLTSWVSLCRLIRGEIIKQKSMDYEAAARSLGMSRRRILIRHLLPNAFYLVIIQFSLIFPLFIHLEVILSYLGLGAGNAVSWGQMIQASLQEMMRTPIVWWQLAAATLAVFGVSLALNLFGDALRDALDPKLL